ncbi:hypothetical protein JRQ81_017829 [Phrynocephalus forsythii]|uniref:Uncharacterized protein n=1 Tax=Phrynocephalus forsythii TaxID=171643 RepID=A0A9Q1B005_9SAUR|nr:hypothetical protein JRQ81_017829 [Phrynocephalus forsythii]
MIETIKYANDISAHSGDGQTATHKNQVDPLQGDNDAILILKATQVGGAKRDRIKELLWAVCDILSQPYLSGYCLPWLQNRNSRKCSHKLEELYKTKHTILQTNQNAPAEHSGQCRMKSSVAQEPVIYY